MKHPIKRKKTERRCPINIHSLCRRWERGDKRINWPKIKKLYRAWLDGEKVPWRKLSHTFIKSGRRPIRRRPRSARRRRNVPRNILSPRDILRLVGRVTLEDQDAETLFRRYEHYYTDFFNNLTLPIPQQGAE